MGAAAAAAQRGADKVLKQRCLAAGCKWEFAECEKDCDLDGTAGGSSSSPANDEAARIARWK